MEQKVQTAWPVEFSGQRKTLFGLSLKGILLMLVTLSIYRFWFVSDVRRYFWSGTVIDGSPLEYTGRGMELFIGFLIALLVLIPLQLAINFVPLLGGSLIVAAPALVIVLFWFLGQYALYRARRYRLSRTYWRGLRFVLGGSPWRYAFLSLGWAVVSIVTLGIAWPWAQAHLERFRINNTNYGDLQFSSSAEARQIMLPSYLMIAPMWILAAIGGMGSLNMLQLQSARLIQFGPIQIAIVFSLVLAALIYPAYSAIRLKAFASRIEAGGARLISQLSVWKIYLIYVAYGLLVVAVYATIVGMFVVMPALTGGSGALSYFPAVGVLAVIILVIAVYILKFMILDFLTWRHIANTSVIKNPGALEDVHRRRADAVSGVGEGFADALDVGGGFEIGI